MSDETRAKAQAEMLANRVVKNAKHLGRWAAREKITCYRLYDRDIPEIPVTIDTYAGALVINDYRFEREATDTWLDEMAAAVQKQLDATEVFFKRRLRHDRREGEQYARLDTTEAWRTVTEGGHTFRVNLADYLDTGLFLDQRITRAKAAAEPAKTMLNLFAYTGSFSVYCGAVGMRTTTVDMSRTYLDLAHKNLELNRLDSELLQSDVREFLLAARNAGRRWDLAVVDPPTFSSSKRMDYTFDVQRDHAALLDDVAAVADVILFSTNRKKFKLTWEGSGAEIADLTYATTPQDFKHRPHHAYRIKV
ncbi:MAG: class I SAM-dependent methyltransferase [Deltaproteobacteria bacterium]|nr:class I SAM-dependent methyltransferase [Deltaproteobacteria bacterium]